MASESPLKVRSLVRQRVSVPPAVLLGGEPRWVRDSERRIVRRNGRLREGDRVVVRVVISRG